MSSGHERLEQGKVHQVAKRMMNGKEDAESLRRRRVTGKASSGQEGMKQRGGHRVARRLPCSLLVAAKVIIPLNVGACGPIYAF